MNIKKLTITPIELRAKAIIIKTPTEERAAQLIKERLACQRNTVGNKNLTITPKLPKFLRGFVNPQTYVGKIF